MKAASIVAFVVIFGTVGFLTWQYFQRAKPTLAPTPLPTEILFGDSTSLPPDDGRFRWGVQIRPNAMNRYTDALMDQQLDLAKELGIGWIRLDWHNYNDLSWHKAIIDKAAERGMHTVLILEDVGVLTDAPNAPARARERVKGIVQALKGRVRYYQLFNEVSGTALNGPTYPGTNFYRDYNQAKYRELRDWMKEAIAGIRAADPNARLIVSAQWTHTAFIEQLIKDGVQFDILGWNWFSDMGEDLNEPIVGRSLLQSTTLLDKLRGFGKELWITELNYRPTEAGMDEGAQAAYLKKMAERIVGYQTFKGLFVFELLDQSEVTAKGGKPEYYGIVKFDKDAQGNWIIGAKKQAFEAYKQVIAKLSK